MAKKRQSSARTSTVLDESRTLVMKESGDWVSGTIYHKAAGFVSIPLDLLLSGQRNEALSLVSRSKRIVSGGNIAEVVDAMFTNVAAFKAELDK